MGKIFDETNFKEPENIYKPTPFWGLNGRLEKTELLRQINLFHEQGYGGIYLHPRAGMITDYLSGEYFDALRYCIDEAKRLGMQAWLYDEDWCPSGKAGNKVLKSNPNLSSKYIRRTDNKPGFEIIQTQDETGNYRHTNIDVCDPDAIDRFIEITHEKYFEKFGEYFGNVIPAIFTDEPHFNPETQNALPWAKNFEIKFKEKYNYDILNHVTELFSDDINSAKVKFDYWNLMSELFVESYSKKIYDWCEDKNIAYTGHFWEHVFPSPMHGGSVMPHYEFMHYPGIDMLFVADDNSPEQYSNDFIVKEVSSVANQFGKERVLSEANGASGWGLDFAYQKRAFDWQLALGVNLFTLHLSFYDMTGYRKRDFPMSYLDHQPWWEDLRLLTDYVGRMSYALSQGQYAADVLVLHPSSSTWAANSNKLPEIGKSVQNTVKYLNQLKIMFDLGDDIILKRHAKVIDGEIFVGKMTYKTIIIPDMIILRKEIFELLQYFYKTGGNIVCVGEPPYLLDGEKSDELIKFFSEIKKIKNNKTELEYYFSDKTAERINLTETNGKNTDKIYAHIRDCENQRLVFLCNSDMQQDYELLVWFDKACDTVIFDGETGEPKACKIYTNQNGQYYIKIKLYALQSVLLRINKNIEVETQTEKTVCNNKTVLRLSDWNVSLKDPNALHLQFCKVSLDGGAYGELQDVLKADDNLKDFLGMERGAIFTREPWMYSEEEQNEKHRIKAEYPFYIDEIPTGKLMTAVELPEQFDVFINETKILPNGGYYKDRAFALYDISENIKPGENIIRIETKNYGVNMNIESVYIVGDFRLTKNENEDFSICFSGPLTTGNIVEQGCPYYSGRIAYETQVKIGEDFNNAYLEFKKFDGVTLTVYVNGEKIKTVGWNPYIIDLTGKLKKGGNNICIELANSLQNLLGPFGSQANQNLVHPGSFYAEKHEIFFPFGFNGEAEIYIT